MSGNQPYSAQSASSPADSQHLPPIVGIGAAAGGLEALQRFFAHLPPDSGMAFVLVQHLDSRHQSTMAAWLRKHTAMEIVPAADNMRVEPDHVYLVPPNATLTIHQGVLRLTPPQAYHGSQVSVDVFFRSLAQDQGERASAVVLSGTGGDGALGVRAIKEHGGLTVVQADATHDGMPQNAVATGVVDYVLPVAEMPAKLVEYIRQSSRLLHPQGSDALAAEATTSLEAIFEMLQTHTGHDFRCYKPDMVVRRIQRRMQVLALDSMQQYVETLRRSPTESEALFKDLLIGVTHFFRDPEAFAVLATEVIPQVFAAKKPDEPVRVWVPGCATGEEAYSIAMVLSEQMARANKRLKMQIFATDIDARALEVARAGIYPESIAADVSAERLRQFFTHQEHSYQIVKPLREACIFSEHNLIKDPPFSRLDLISCRNVLIYLQSQLHSQLLPRFHYALRPGGYLLLGPAENASGTEDLFATVDVKHELFRRQDGTARSTFALPFAPLTPMSREPDHREGPPDPGGPVDWAKTADRLVLAHHAPAYVLINDQAEVIYSSSRTGRYLELPPGQPNVNIINMARPELRAELRAIIYQAARERRVVRRNNIRLPVDGEAQQLHLVVRPVTETGREAGAMLVLFEEIGPATSQDQPARGSESGDQVVQQLTSELTRTKEDLQTTIEELATSNEELQASNEELVSVNGELQAANEELEASQAELQSINQELGTVNAELQYKIEELARANSDIKNYLDGTQIATIFLDRSRRIKSFTPAIGDIFRLLPGDLGRPITDIAPRLAYDHLSQDLEHVLRTSSPVERQLQSPEGSWYIMRIIPYRTVDDRIDGAVMTFVDIGVLKQAQEEIHRLNRSLQARLAELESLLDLIPVGIAISNDPESRSLHVNRQGYAILGVPEGSNISQRHQDGESQYRVLRNGQDLRPEEFPMQRASILGETVRNEEFLIVRRDGSPIDVLMSATPLYNDGGEIEGAIGVFMDITLRKQAQHEVERRTQQHAVIAELGLRALEDTDVQAVMQEAAVRLTATLAVEYCEILQLSPDGADLGLQAGVGWRQGLVGQATVSADSTSQAGFTLLANKPVIVEDLRAERRFHASSLLVEHGAVSGISVIIHGNERPYGVLGAFTTTRRTFTADDINFLQSIANILTSALQRERLEEEAVRSQVQRTERLASIGTLAAGIAHEMNNPLNAILMNIEYVVSLLDLPAAHAAEITLHLHDILHEAQRCGRIVKNLLRFAREKPTQKEPYNLNEIIERAVGLAEHYTATGEAIIHCDLATRLPLVQLNPTEIEQMIANLVQNAIDAAGGRVIIHLTTEVRQAGVRLVVQDNGPGIAKERLPHVFDPFYSTRRHRGGTGLGLSIVHAIVRDHAGTVNVTSTVGKGTTFVITLPPASEGLPNHDEDSCC